MERQINLFEYVADSHCSNCLHQRGKDSCYLRECHEEPRLSCNGCIDWKKKSYKGTKCLHCKRYCFNPDIIREGITDYYREVEDDRITD